MHSKISELCELKPAKKEAKIKLKDTDLVSFIPMNTLGIGEKNVVGIEEKQLSEVYSGYTYFAENDVLLAKITPCFENGKLGIAKNLKNSIGFGSSEYIVLRSLGKIDPEYLFYFLSQEKIRSEGSKVMTGAVGHKRIPNEFIENLEILLPTLKEQKRIVAILDEAFAGISQAIANTEKNLANARELFENYLNNAIKGDSTWRKTKLGTLCNSVEYGSSAKSGEQGQVPVLRMGNIQNRKIDWENLVYTSDPIEIEKYKLKENDILFNRTNSVELVGKTAIIKDGLPAIFAGYLIRLNRKEDLLDADFLNYYLNSSSIREYGRSIMSSSVHQANINGSKLKEYPINIPSLNIQKEIVKKISKLENEVEQLEATYQQKLQSLAELKQSLLQKAFSGALTANNVDKQVNL